MHRGEFLDCNTIWHYTVHYTPERAALLEFARMSIVGTGLAMISERKDERF